MSVVHEYTLIIQWSEEDQLYLAYSPELPGCITHGRTYVQAAEMGVEVMELWCDAACAAGEALPAPLQYQGEGTVFLFERWQTDGCGPCVTQSSLTAQQCMRGMSSPSYRASVPKRG